MLNLLPSKISYSTLSIRLDGVDGREIRIPRRELWDVRVQLMAEDDEEGLGNLGKDDVKTGVYEGGFKSWESSVDVVRVVDGRRSLFEGGRCVFEVRYVLYSSKLLTSINLMKRMKADFDSSAVVPLSHPLQFSNGFSNVPPRPRELSILDSQTTILLFSNSSHYPISFYPGLRSPKQKPGKRKANSKLTLISSPNSWQACKLTTSHYPSTLAPGAPNS
jgi:hypothetical protein